jgi:hypothetical protein
MPAMGIADLFKAARVVTLDNDLDLFDHKKILGLIEEAYRRGKEDERAGKEASYDKYYVNTP